MNRGIAITQLGNIRITIDHHVANLGDHLTQIAQIMAIIDFTSIKIDNTIMEAITRKEKHGIGDPKLDYQNEGHTQEGAQWSRGLPNREYHPPGHPQYIPKLQRFRHKKPASNA